MTQQEATAWDEVHFVVPADHPCLAGHFPGNPIVPGVVLLDEALARLPVAGSSDLMLSTAKFTGPVRAGEPVQVRWRRTGDGVAFTGSVGGHCVLRGTARVR